MKITHILLTIAVAVLANSYGISQQQELGSSITLGVEAYRPWSVSPSGFASTPFTIRYSARVQSNWRVVIGMGWEQSRESGVDEINFSDQFQDGMGNTVTRSASETTTIFDRVLGAQAGVRYLIPGGPDRVRLLAGVDLLGAYFPERSLVTNSRQMTVNQDNQVQAEFVSESVGRGYEGYGFGTQASIGVEITVSDGLLLGLEIGPGRFARFRDTQHTIMTTGSRQMEPNFTEVIEFETENVGFEGESSSSSARFRGMLYVGWEF
ncbi:MAG: outer membrane beta-barrel protein [Bacteroidia bacterium]|nr:outer membrane beta-barrel protein [Bacteroidia bacterium]